MTQEGSMTRESQVSNSKETKAKERSQRQNVHSLLKLKDINIKVSIPLNIATNRNERPPNNAAPNTTPEHHPQPLLIDEIRSQHLPLIHQVPLPRRKLAYLLQRTRRLSTKAQTIARQAERLHLPHNFPDGGGSPTLSQRLTL